MTDEKILRALRAGDDGTAVGAAMAKYSRLLWSVAAPILREAASEQDIEECVADAFIYLWQNPDKFDPARGKLKTWLCIVARSRATDKYRELTRRGGTVALDETERAAGTPDDALIAAEDGARLDAALDRLGEPERELLLRRYWGGQKPREIAAALSLPPKRVENGLYRAKAKLRELLSE